MVEVDEKTWAKVRWALEFYADFKNWESDWKWDYWGPVFDDEGAKARKVLKAIWQEELKRRK